MITSWIYIVLRKNDHCHYMMPTVRPVSTGSEVGTKALIAQMVRYCPRDDTQPGDAGNED
jgi:hypothetical protein